MFDQKNTGKGKKDRRNLDIHSLLVVVVNFCIHYLSMGGDLFFAGTTDEQLQYIAIGLTVFVGLTGLSKTTKQRDFVG